jgi:CheY-like chemotaxis protein
VLIVEDDHVSRILAGKLVSLLGFTVEFAEDGLQGVEAFVPGKYSAVLMDMQMPVMDGIEATRRIRQIERDAGASPVALIALTANVMHGDRDRCIAAGMTDFLSKPVNRADLAAKLRAATARS